MGAAGLGVCAVLVGVAAAWSLSWAVGVTGETDVNVLAGSDSPSSKRPEPLYQLGSEPPRRGAAAAPEPSTGRPGASRSATQDGTPKETGRPAAPRGSTQPPRRSTHTPTASSNAHARSPHGQQTEQHDDARGSADPTGASSSGASTRSATPEQADVALEPGDHGPRVRMLQRRLFRRGQLDVFPSGTYDARTERGVSRLQRDYGVTGDPDGVYGPRTQAAVEGD